jgi:hypothetical protein
VVRAHLTKGNVGEARRHIADVWQLMIDELGVPPSAGLCDLAGGSWREGEFARDRKSAARGTVR